MIEVITNRHNELIDPHLEVWGWEIAGYLFVGGVVAGIMVLSALLHRRSSTPGPDAEPLSRWVRWLPFAAPALITLGMGMLFLDLEHPSRVFRFYLSFEVSSPMSWGAWLLLGIYPATLLLGLISLTDDEAERLAGWAPLRVTRLGRLIGWARRTFGDRAAAVRAANIALGLGLGVYTGILLGSLQARALWSSSLLGPLFLVSGLSTGAAFMMLFPLAKGEHSSLRRWDLILIAAELALIGLFLLDRATNAGPAAERFFGGDLTAAFWSFVVFMGLLLPWSLEVLEKRRHLKPTIAAPVLILLGGLVLRGILVFAGQDMGA